MEAANAIKLDAVIFGGGVAGLWLLDELVRQGYSCVLLESAGLGQGQTIVSQGIIHGGLKYTLDGLLNRSAEAIREMPRVWRECLAGDRQPVLTRTRVLSEFCYLWRTSTLASLAGMVGARVGLRTRPQRIAPAERPAVLADCPGDVFRIDEPVLDPASLLQELADRHAQRLWRYQDHDGIEFVSPHAGRVAALRIQPLLSGGGASVGEVVRLEPAHVILTAGGGNEALARRCGVTTAPMQRRPLHMVMVRGDLPALWGHCTDGARTRVTITSAAAGSQNVWQVGGQLAEDGVRMEAPQLLAHARRELQATLPGAKLDRCAWATYRVDRAEPRTAGGMRPSEAWCQRQGNVIVAWPTKLALAPRLAQRVLDLLEPPAGLDAPLPPWPAPPVAPLPWAQEQRWYTDV